ncbi:hypothetical protein [Coleofasciculus sp. E2-BRE-01]|uniref:hypothetical protein n=1 Tax=Coleofasciculus sp. E2-BRE-01 TaxID=3069524 RepID=UPI0032FF5956
MRNGKDGEDGEDEGDGEDGGDGGDGVVETFRWNVWKMRTLIQNWIRAGLVTFGLSKKR